MTNTKQPPNPSRLPKVTYGKPSKAEVKRFYALAMKEAKGKS
jgi:hypothetical protein